MTEAYQIDHWWEKTRTSSGPPKFWTADRNRECSSGVHRRRSLGLEFSGAAATECIIRQPVWTPQLVMGDKEICGQQQRWRCSNKVYHQTADLNTAPVCKQSWVTEPYVGGNSNAGAAAASVSSGS